MQCRFVPRAETGRTIGEHFAVRLTLRLSRRGPSHAGLTAARRPLRRTRDAAGANAAGVTLVRFVPNCASERGRVGLSRELGARHPPLEGGFPERPLTSSTYRLDAMLMPTKS